MVSKGKSLAIKIVIGVLIAGLLAAVIGLGVSLGQSNSAVKKLQDQWDTHQDTHKVTTIDPTAPTTTATPGPAPRYRLPVTVRPLSYKLFLQIHLPFNAAEETTLPNAFTTKDSNVEITIQAVEADVKEIILHARTSKYLSATSQTGHIKEFKKEAVTLKEDAAGSPAGPTVTDVLFEPVDILVVKLETALVKDKKYVLAFKFDGVIADDNQGLYRSSFIDTEGTKRWLATSQFQPFKARRVFPCFDEPHFRSEFSTTLKYPTKFSLTRTNGRAEPNPIVEGTWTTTKYTTTPSMPAYLNAFLVSDFDFDTDEVTEAGGNTFTHNVIGAKNLIDRGDGLFALEQGGQMMQNLYETYEREYPLDKLDMAGVPDFNSGAMENWGLVLYREASLMYQKGVSTADNKRGVAAIIGHELAHMIFGNLVTCDWWSDTWLNEGFARFMQYELMEHTKPTWKVMDIFAYWVIREAMQPDSYDTSHALFDNNVNTLPQIETMFDTITYAKGASVIEMIRNVMGHDNFYAALKTYVAEFQLKTVKHADLLKHFEPITPGIGNHLTGWITQGGYPVVTLTRGAGDASDITYTQERFLLHESTTNSLLWHVPLTLTDGSRKLADTTQPDIPAYLGCWLTDKNGPLTTACTIASGSLVYPPLPASNADSMNYIIANVQQKAYYRVNYDRQNWQRIIDALQNVKTTTEAGETTVHVLLKEDSITRGQLYDDAFNLARAGKLVTGNTPAETEEQSYEIPFSLINAHLTVETKYSPLASAMDNVRYIEQMLRGTEHYQVFSTYMQGLAEKLYKLDIDMWTTAWTDADVAHPVDEARESSYDSILFNNLVIETACYYGLPLCLQHAREKFAVWRALPEPFGPDHAPGNTVQSRNLVLCYGVRGLDEKELENWNYLMELYDKPTTTISNKLTILRALACTQHENLLQRILTMTTNGQVRAQDVASVVSYVARYPAGDSLSWDFLRSEWAKLTRRANIITDVGGRLKDAWRLEQLRTLYATAGGETIGEGPTFVRIIARVEANIKWLKSYAQHIARIVKQL